MTELSLRTLDTNLNFQKTKESFSFLHRDSVLFHQNKVNPVYFVQATVEGGVNVPLKDVYVNVEKNGEFLLECKHNEEYEIFIRIREEGENTVSFSVENPHLYKNVTLSFYKQFSDRVLDMNAYRPVGKSGCDFFREQRLSFCLENKFYFENRNICSGFLRVTDTTVDVTFSQSNNSFVLHMGKDLAQIKKEKIDPSLFYFQERKVFVMQEALRKIKTRPDGIICDAVYAKDENLKNRFSYVICRLPLSYTEWNNYTVYFDESELKYEGGVYKMDFSKPGTRESFKTVVRKIFDIRNVDGVYLDLQDYGGAEIVLIKDAIREVRAEYDMLLPKVILYDKISPVNDYDGYYMIEDERKTIGCTDYPEYYSFIGEFYLGAVIRREEDIRKVGSACNLIVIA